jgi:hypothetical protein
MRRLTASLAVAWLLLGTAHASEEDILPTRTRKLTISADGGRNFGEVSAAIETAKDGRIKSINLFVGDKCYAVPQEQLTDLGPSLLHTAQFRAEAGRGGPPWLYLTFRVATPGALDPADCPLVYIRFRDGKVMDRHIRTPSR